MTELSAAVFGERVQAAAPEPLSAVCVAALYVHYRLLCRWNAGTSLVGPGTLDAAAEVHYGESLAALPLLGSGDGTLVDVGSGAGFPGLVLAAARPALRVVLVEARERKWAFLKAASAEAGVRVECLLGAIDAAFPLGFPVRVDFVTLRALKLPARAWRALATRLTERGRVLVWAGRDDPEIPPVLRVRRSLPLSGSHSKRILELERDERLAGEGADG